MRLSPSITLALNITYLDPALIQRLSQAVATSYRHLSCIARQRRASGMVSPVWLGQNARRASTVGKGGAMGILSLLRSNWFWTALIAVLYSVAVVIHGSASYDRGYATARAEGDAALLNLQLQHSNELAKIAEDNLLQFQQQVTRANQAEARFLSAQDQFTALQQQLSERIAHVSDSIPAGTRCFPVPAPRFVVTCGWLRDYDHTLGADLPLASSLQNCRQPSRNGPGPPPALTPNYWKAVSARLTSWPMPAITGNGLSPTWRN
ncbi:hypothetical protein ACNUI5_09145 [Pseudomonas aeruginosa]